MTKFVLMLGVRTTQLRKQRSQHLRKTQIVLEISITTVMALPVSTYLRRELQTGVPAVLQLLIADVLEKQKASAEVAAVDG